MAGITAGWMAAPPPIERRALVVQAGLLAALGAAADLDLLIGRHSGETHSIGAAAIAATVAMLWRWPIARAPWRIFVAAWLAWASHPLLDALSPDNSAPIGVMALWPFSHAYMQTGLAIFEPIWRNPTRWREIRHDMWAAIKEVAILAPLLVSTYRIRVPSSARADLRPPS